VILIDLPLWPTRGPVSSPMVSDMSCKELHAFVAVLGMPPRTFERDY